MAVRGGSGERGQASVELIAVLPAAALLCALAVQVALIGWTLWSAEGSARAGARVAAIGGDTVAAARSALPDPLREGARVTDDGRIRVEVTAPQVVPGIPSVRVEAGGALPGPGDG